jgi:hypothetical protein
MTTADHSELVNARGVLYHSPRIDPGGRYPPCSEHTRDRAVEPWLS